MVQNNKICKVCGKAYKFCPACNENRANPKPNWYKTYDSEECKLIFDTAVLVGLKKISAYEAQQKLNGCDLNKDFDEDLQVVINEIKSARKPYVKETVEDIVKED